MCINMHMDDTFLLVLHYTLCKQKPSYWEVAIASLFVCLLLARQPPMGQGLLIIEVSRSHTTTHHSRWDSSGRVISSSQRPLPDNTQHSLHTDIHVPGGIRTQNLSNRAAADLRLRAIESRIINITCKQKQQQFSEMLIEIVIDTLSAEVVMNLNICMFIYIYIL
jgi:hypothetical protein